MSNASRACAAFSGADRTTLIAAITRGRQAWVAALTKHGAAMEISLEPSSAGIGVPILYTSETGRLWCTCRAVIHRSVRSASPATAEVAAGGS